MCQKGKRMKGGEGRKKKEKAKRKKEGKKEGEKYTRRQQTKEEDKEKEGEKNKGGKILLTGIIEKKKKYGNEGNGKESRQGYEVILSIAEPGISSTGGPQYLAPRLCWPPRALLRVYPICH